MGKFTDKGIKALTKPGRYPDGDGLYLYVAPGGTKSWVQRIVVNGRRRDIGLGPYPLVGLAKARDLAADNRAAVAEGRDPIADKRNAKESARNPVPSVPSFAEAASRVIELRRPTWKSSKHAAQWQSTLETYAFPVIGNMAVDEITPSHVLSVLEPIWTDKNETATRVKQRIGTVMDWAVQHGYRPYNPAGKGLLTALPPVRRNQEHLPALPYERVGWAIGLVRESNANLLTKLAFEFLVLTTVRSGVVRNANWGEILWQRRTWEVPFYKMKAWRNHRVPLSDRAMEILTEARGLTGPDGLVFPAVPGGKAMSDMTFTALLRRLEVPAVPHGFRRSFRNWAAERMKGWAAEAEAALAHQVKDKTEAAYLTTDLFDDRIVLMQKWADYVAGETPREAGRTG